MILNQEEASTLGLTCQKGWKQPVITSRLGQKIDGNKYCTRIKGAEEEKTCVDRKKS